MGQTVRSTKCDRQSRAGVYMCSIFTVYCIQRCIFARLIKRFNDLTNRPYLGIYQIMAFSFLLDNGLTEIDMDIEALRKNSDRHCLLNSYTRVW